MKPQFLIVALVALLPFGAQAANYATCVLDEVPKTRTDAAAVAVSTACTNRYGGMAQVAQGSGRGSLGSFDSGAECVKKKAKDLRSEGAATMIRFACNRLYNPKAGDPFKR